MEAKVKPVVFILVIAAIAACTGIREGASITGELKKWHKVTLTFSGPDTGEDATPNPFLDYRLNVTFTKGSRHYTVPGYYVADGSASETGADSGNKWRVHFTPDEVGTWTYEVSFRSGPAVAVKDSPKAGSSVAFDMLEGTFDVAPTDKAGRDHRGKGRLQYVGERYLRFTESGEYFIKGGADSPENLLGYVDFDGTFDLAGLDREGEAKGDSFLHAYTPHQRDWRPGDPTWKGGKGKNIIGALNYLASKGMNSVYFLTYNIDGGDGQDVWPWTGPDERYRFDCSKLDQWEIVFSHMDRLGLMLHVITQETENDQSLDGGELGSQRKLYYRELVARFGHHLALVWNLGEENTNTDAQRRAFAGYLKQNDPYGHPVVVHTYPGQYDQVYNPLLGFADFDGPSLQMNETGSDTHSETIKWIERSAASGHRWIVCLDEYGHGSNGVMPDVSDPTHDQPRKNCLWGNLMAGGAGVEWYFGYTSPHNDLNCEDWRSRDHMWDLTRHALEFFHKHLPFQQMSSADSLVSRGWCLAGPGDTYAVYLSEGGTTNLNVTSGRYTIRWYNPRSGGELLNGSVTDVIGPGVVSLGDPPDSSDKDWVILCKNINTRKD